MNEWKAIVKRKETWNLDCEGDEAQAAAAAAAAAAAQLFKFLFEIHGVPHHPEA